MADFVRYPHPALAAKAEPRPVDAALLAVGERLLAAAIEAMAYGLAAAHIGEVAPVIVLNTAPRQPKPMYQLYYNPRVVETSVETDLAREASVSLPGVETLIERADWAEIAWDDAEGRPHQARLTDFLGRCAQHEIEQMNGRFYLLNVSRLKREMMVKKSAKLAGQGRLG